LKRIEDMEEDSEVKMSSLSNKTMDMEEDLEVQMSLLSKKTEALEENKSLL